MRCLFLYVHTSLRFRHWIPRLSSLDISVATSSYELVLPFHYGLLPVCPWWPLTSDIKGIFPPLDMYNIFSFWDHVNHRAACDVIKITEHQHLKQNLQPVWPGQPRSLRAKSLPQCDAGFHREVILSAFIRMHIKWLPSSWLMSCLS